MVDPFQEIEPLLVDAWQASQTLQAPPRMAPTAPRPSPPGMTWCACQEKCIPFEEVTYHDSKFLKGIADSMCRECRKNVKNHALIACIYCNGIVAKPAPEKFFSGFVLVPGVIYHTNGCPNCLSKRVPLAAEPEMGAVTHVTVLLEKVYFEHANGFPVKPEILVALKLKK